MCNIWSCPKQAQWSGCVHTQRIMVWPVDSPEGQSTGRGLITRWVLLLADLVKDAGSINICTTFNSWCLMSGLGWINCLTAGMIETCYDSAVETASVWNTLCIFSYLLYFIIVIKIRPLSWYNPHGYIIYLFVIESYRTIISYTKKMFKKAETQTTQCCIVLKITEGWLVNKMLIMNGNLIADMYVMTCSIYETPLIHILCHHRVYGESK